MNEYFMTMDMFGLCNTPAAFQNWMVSYIFQKPCYVCVIFLADILIFHWESTLSNMRFVIHQLMKNDIYTKLEKKKAYLKNKRHFLPVAAKKQCPSLAYF